MSTSEQLSTMGASHLVLKAIRPYHGLVVGEESVRFTNHNIDGEFYYLLNFIFSKIEIIKHKALYKVKEYKIKKEETT
jgi:hypothetical protein